MGAVLATAAILTVACTPANHQRSYFQPPGSATGSGIYVDAGHAFTFSDMAVRNSTDEPVTLDRVSIIGPARGFRIVGALARRLVGREFLSGDLTFPPSSSHATSVLSGRRPLRGFVVNPKNHPGASVQIMIGLLPTARGRNFIHGVALHYHDEHGDSHTYAIPTAVLGCTNHESRCQIDGPVDLVP